MASKDDIIEEQQEGLNDGLGTGNNTLIPPAGDSLIEEGPVVELTLEQKILRGVDKWVHDNLRNTAFSRDTEVWNILQAAIPKLPGTILEEVS